MKITYEQAKAQWNHIELNPPEGDLAIQLEIHWDHVSLTIPYWYTGAKADQVFDQLSAYLRIIREAAGLSRTILRQTERLILREKSSANTANTTELLRTCLRSLRKEPTKPQSRGGNSGKKRASKKMSG